MFSRILKFVGVSFAIYLAIALGLTFSQTSQDRTGQDSLDFSRQSTRSMADPAPLLSIEAKDGSKIYFRRHESTQPNRPLMILIHGSGWHGASYDSVADRLAKEGIADVLVPDLRGHGPNTQQRGDVNYIGQLEDDLAELINSQRRDGQKIILTGHSSGGGLAIRFAGGPHGKLLSGAVLLAPFLKYNAPTIRPNSGGWAHPLTRRIIGLSMLNMIGLKSLNHLTVLDFAFPKSVIEGSSGSSATQQYSYRLNTSYAPRFDYLKDIAALPPFLLVAGRNDEAFKAEQFEPTMTPANPTGIFKLLDGVSHLDVVYEEQTHQAIVDYVNALVAKP